MLRYQPRNVLLAQFKNLLIYADRLLNRFPLDSFNRVQTQFQKLPNAQLILIVNKNMRIGAFNFRQSLLIFLIQQFTPVIVNTHPGSKQRLLPGMNPVVQHLVSVFERPLARLLH